MRHQRRLRRHAEHLDTFLMILRYSTARTGPGM